MGPAKFYGPEKQKLRASTIVSIFAQYLAFNALCLSGNDLLLGKRILDGAALNAYVLPQDNTKDVTAFALYWDFQH